MSNPYTPGTRAVWRPESKNVTVVAANGLFVCVCHRDYGTFWTPARELNVLPRTP